jgi:hypothetical protein
MVLRLSREALEAEAHTRSEDVSDSVLTEATTAVLRRPVIDRQHDIPYIAGYSRDGKTIFIDRHLPRSFQFKGKRIHVERFIVLHELVEKSLLDEMRLHYLHAHQIALRTEQAAVRAAGVTWRAYNAFTKANEKKISDERLLKVPRSLDLTPYRDEDDFATLARAVKAEPS